MRTSPCSSRRPRSVLLVSLYGFAAAEGGFKGMKPWEEEHERKNERGEVRVAQEEQRVSKGESGLLGLDPLLKRFSLPPFLFFFLCYILHWDVAWLCTLDRHQSYVHYPGLGLARQPDKTHCLVMHVSCDEW